MNPNYTPHSSTDPRGIVKYEQEIWTDKEREGGVEGRGGAENKWKRRDEG